jgi:hypothetical protein
MDASAAAARVDALMALRRYEQAIDTAREVSRLRR